MLVGPGARRHRSPSAQVLTNTDLVYPIFTFIPPDILNSSLARCATVCRTFHRPAIQVLWRNLRSLLPLWHLLAPSNIPFDTNHYSTTSYDVLKYLHEVISAQLYHDPIRWDRFLYHAAHVREVAHHMHMAKEVNDASRHLIQAVIGQNGGATIFPLLHTLRIHLPDSDTVVPFLTSTLRHITFFSMWPIGTRPVLLLRRLRDSCPSLEEIVLDPGSEPNLALLIIQELARFPRLQAVEVSSCLGLEAFRILATKPNLGCLSIPALIGPWVAPRSLISVRDLRELSVGGDESSLSRLFGVARFYALTNANITIDSSEAETNLTVANVTSLLALFYDAVSTSPLQSFEFTPWPQRYETEFDVMLPLREFIAAILPIRDLRSFTLIAKYPVASLDDADIDALANAWPKLEHLSLHRGFTSESRVSFHALHGVHRNCTHLQELSVTRLRWPTIGVDAIPTPLADRSLTHPLQELSLPRRVTVKTDLPLSGIDLSDEGVEAMARYLFDLFPRLDLQRCKRGWDEARPPKPGGMRWGTNSTRRRRLYPKDLHFDDRWWKVVGHICSLCRARDGL